MADASIPELDRRGLRQFGWMLGGFLAGGFGLLVPWLWGLDRLPVYEWFLVGAVFVAWASIAPDSLRLVYRSWMRIALAVGKVVNTLILAVVFFIFVAPMGLVMRMLGHDPMRRKLDRAAGSYRVESKVSARDQVEKPY